MKRGRSTGSLPSPVYPLTDAAGSGMAHAEMARVLVSAGARWLQLRDKSLPAAALLEDYRAACRLARARGAAVLVNDRADLALLAGASGVHVGESDLPAEAARRLLGERALVGISSHSPAAAEAASRLPVDYVALGPIFASPSKPGARAALGLGALRAARLKVAVPLVAIGGIGPETLADVLQAGADAAALISAVWRAPEGAAQRLRRLLREARRVVSGRPLAGRHLYLVGFMGAGKSTVGPLVAQALARPFIDLDAEVERRCGCTIAELFARRGQARFRGLERRALASVSRGRDAVIALGGGALGAAANRRRVAQGASVWLDVPLAELRARCLRPGAPVRPLLQAAGQFERLYNARRRIYARANLCLPAGTAEPPALAAAIVARLAGHRSAKIRSGAGC